MVKDGTRLASTGLERTSWGRMNARFFEYDGVALARRLIGTLLVHRIRPGEILSGIIVETEAYCGPDDKAAHSHNWRRTVRTEVFYRRGGAAYVFLIHGMHVCFNVVAGAETMPHAVLVRALEPVDGIAGMKERRGRERLTELTNGPGKLTRALGITMEHYGLDLVKGPELYIARGVEVPPEWMETSPRIGIDYAEEWRDVPWRFFISGNPFVSK